MGLDGRGGTADPAAIPPSLALDDPDYRLKAGHLDYAAHYLLIDDNLLDLSHLCFAHEKTLGLDMPQWADERPRMLPLERGLRVQRWLTGHPPRGFMKKKLGEHARCVELLRFRLSRRVPAAHQSSIRPAPPSRAAGGSPIGRRCSCASTSRP